MGGARIKSPRVSVWVVGRTHSVAVLKMLDSTDIWLKMVVVQKGHMEKWLEDLRR
jgi:hypothetical protein